MKPSTPLPWKTWATIEGPTIIGGLVPVTRMGTGVDIANQDAAYIVHAANMHPKLVEALHKLLEDTECYCSDSPGGVCPVHEARAVLAECQEGK